MLNGSNTSTGMGNGEWDLDPQDVQCIGVLELVASIAGATTTLGILTVLDIMMLIKDILKVVGCCLSTLEEVLNCLIVYTSVSVLVEIISLLL